MGDKSPIEWLRGGATWNPVRGCTPCAPECAHCYARVFAERWRGVPGHPYERGFDVRLVPEALELPLRWRKPRSIFVNSMSDLFHDAVPDAFIAAVFGVMAAAPRHTFIVLTKRAERLPRWFAWLDAQHKEWSGPGSEGMECDWRVHAVAHAAFEATGYDGEIGPLPEAWPLPNVTLGVSVGTLERRAAIDLLRQTPAARRMVSFEPLLEDLGDVDLDGIDLAAIGGESGAKARPCDIGWIRHLIARCRASGTAPFVKQLGPRPFERRSTPSGEGYDPRDLLAANPRDAAAHARWFSDWTLVKTATGSAFYRYLKPRDRKGGDPAEWPEDLRVRELPEAPHAP
jgi:protein gp37